MTSFVDLLGPTSPVSIDPFIDPFESEPGCQDGNASPVSIDTGDNGTGFIDPFESEPGTQDGNASLYDFGSAPAPSSPSRNVQFSTDDSAQPVLLAPAVLAPAPVSVGGGLGQVHLPKPRPLGATPPFPFTPLNFTSSSSPFPFSTGNGPLGPWVNGVPQIKTLLAKIAKNEKRQRETAKNEQSQSQWKRRKLNQPNTQASLEAANKKLQARLDTVLGKYAALEAANRDRLRGVQDAEEESKALKAAHQFALSRQEKQLAAEHQAELDSQKMALAAAQKAAVDRLAVELTAAHQAVLDLQGKELEMARATALHQAELDKQKQELAEARLAELDPANKPVISPNCEELIMQIYEVLGVPGK